MRNFKKIFIIVILIWMSLIFIGDIYIIQQRITSLGISDQTSQTGGLSIFVINDPPSSPVLTDQINTTSSSVNLKWVSGADPEGGIVYDEFQLDSGIVQSNVSSPYSVNISLGSHIWKVRTCDFNSCSNWSNDSFNRVIAVPSAGPGGGVSLREYYPEEKAVLPVEYYINLSYPSVVFENEEVSIDVEFKSVHDVEIVIFTIAEIGSYSYENLSKDEMINFSFKHSISEAGEYEFVLEVWADEKLVAQRSFSLSVYSKEFPRELLVAAPPVDIVGYVLSCVIILMIVGFFAYLIFEKFKSIK